MIRVLCNGCFDILHAGHILHLQEARALGDRLIVSLTEDPYVNKGPDRPINTWTDRAIVLSAIRYVDEVVPSRILADAILAVRPNIVVKGSDYEGYEFGPHIIKACKEVGAKLVLTRAPKQSVTDLITKTRELYVRENGSDPTAAG